MLSRKGTDPSARKVESWAHALGGGSAQFLPNAGRILPSIHAISALLDSVEFTEAHHDRPASHHPRLVPILMI